MLSKSRASPSPRLTCDPDSSVIRPPPNSSKPHTPPTTVTNSVANSEKSAIAAYFTASSLVRPTGTVSRYRSVPRLASPAMESPEIAATASGRNNGNSMVSAARATKRPFPVMAEKKSGPPPPPRAAVDFTAMPMMTGTTTSTARPAWLRRRPRMISSSDRRNRVETVAFARRGAPTSDTTGESAADIETLSGQGNEQVFQTRCLEGES